MTRVRVYIATTEGPAEIQRVTDETPGIRSVVCLDGKAVALPISADYDSFVRRPTGVIERLFGHSAFRLDVGTRITDGLSWQLGILLAHWLHANQRLATNNTTADVAIWATGEVDAALAVRAVEGVARKLHTSAGLLRSLAAAHTPILVLVPHANAAAARAALGDLQLLPACRLVDVGTADDAFAVLDPPAPVAPTRQTRRAPPPVRRRRRWPWAVAALPVLGAAAVLALVAAWRAPVLAWQRLTDAGAWLQVQEQLAATDALPHCLTCGAMVALLRDHLLVAAPSRLALHVEATELRGSRFDGCDDDTGMTPRPVNRSAGGGWADSPAAGLCAVRYTVSGAKSIALIVTPGSEPALPTVIGNGAARVDVAMPRRVPSPREYRLLVMAADVPLEPLIATLAQQEDGPDSPAWQQRLRQLAGPSVLVFEVRHRIVP